MVPSVMFCHQNPVELYYVGRMASVKMADSLIAGPYQVSWGYSTTEHVLDSLTCIANNCAPIRST